MKPLFSFLASLIVLSLACNFGSADPLAVTPGAAPAPTDPGQQLAGATPSRDAVESPLPTTPRPPRATETARKFCGDGICDGPENAVLCPQDCTFPTIETQVPIPANDTVKAGIEPDTYRVTNPTSGVDLLVRVLYPTDRQGKTFSTLVMVAGGTGCSQDFMRRPDQTAAFTENGFVLVLFDPDGRCDSDGREDQNGTIHQDGLAAIIRATPSFPGVNPDRIGLVSYSYGVTMATGVLARYPDLGIRFLIDWEGPANRNDTGGCDADRTGHLVGTPCNDEIFWSQREASTFALQIQVPYLRLQTEQDHAQPDNDHALFMIENATSVEFGGRGLAPWTRLNDLPPNTVYEEPPSMLPEDTRTGSLIARSALELFSSE